MASTHSGGDQPRRSPWLAITIVVAVLAVIGVAVYLFLYTGDTGGTSGGGAGNGGAGAGGYFAVAIGGEVIRRIVRTFRTR